MNTREFSALLIKSIATGNVTTQLSDVFQQGIRYTDLKRSHLAKLDEPLIFNGRVVNKMQLIQAADTPNRQACDYILMHFDDSAMPFILNSRMTKALKDAFMQLGATEEKLFAEHSIPTVNWLARSQRQVYVKECQLDGNNRLVKHYDELHARLVKRMRDIIQAEPETQFNIVDGGCGDGSLLKRVEEENLPARLAGFDINHTNVMQALIKQSQHNVSFFTTGNLLVSDKIVARLIEQNKLHGSRAKTIMVLSGSLTRRVLNNVYQALDVFTAIARQSSIQYVLGGGINQPLINRYFAKQMGFTQKPQTDSAHEYDFWFERMPREEFVGMKLAKMHKKKLVDLSFCPDDAMLTTLLPHITADMKIDLSFCRYTKAVEQALSLVIKRFPNIQIIMQHTNANVISAFSKRFKSAAKILSLQLVPANNELHLFNAYRKIPRYKFFDPRTQTAKPSAAPLRLKSRL